MPPHQVNAAQIALWNGIGGERRARQPRLVDSQVRLHSERLRSAAAVGTGERVLDVGCGTGESTRDAARAATAVSVLGVDVSTPMLAVARQLAADEGLRNVTFEEADAQVHPFGPERFDVAISRFGVMFFEDPVAAFANIGRALRPAGRLAVLVWQARELNEWAMVFRQALSGRPEMPDLPARQHAFSMADPGAVTETLEAAGFTGVSLTGVEQPVFYGDDVETSCGLVVTLQTAIEVLATMDEAEKARALDRLRAALAARETADGITFEGRSWVVTARRG